MKVLLDADILIGALDSNDLHHTQASKLFKSWRRSQTLTLMSIINLTEVLVAPAQDKKNSQLLAKLFLHYKSLFTNPMKV